MKAIKIYAKDSKYYMEDLDTNQTYELTQTAHQKRDNTDWFKLPENSANCKLVCKQMIDKKGEIVREYKESRTLGPRDPNAPKTVKTPKIDWTKYLTEDEQKVIDDIKKKCEERAQEDIKKAKIEALKAEIARLMGEV